MNNKLTRVVKVGGFSHVKPVLIGGDNPVVVQTMWKDRFTFDNLDYAVEAVSGLEKIGCSLLRFAIPDIQSVEAVGELARMVSMPLVADIHFDYKIALKCMDFPIAKIRINPGNIGKKDRIKAVLEKAGSSGVPIRIGVNAGSLPLDLRKDVENGIYPHIALVQAAEREIAIFKEFGFNNYMVSMKACTIADTIEANKILSQRTDAPLHIGVTEAGPLVAGVVSNTAALINLLREGIGDTVRVSLSDTMENEVIAGREIIRAASELTGANERLKSGVKIVSCPRCGRAGFDTHSFTVRWMPKLYALNTEKTVAIMGCEVNGPSEAKHADLGITGAGDKVLIFRHGKVIKTVDAADAGSAFEEELNKL